MPFPWEQAISSGVQILGSLRANAASSGNNRAQIGAAFDQRAGIVKQAFDAIQAQAVITANDYNAASQLLNQLAAIVAEYGPQNPYITEQWESSAYRPAFEARLAQIKMRVIADATLNVAMDARASVWQTESFLPGVTNLQLALIAGAIVGLKLLKG